MSQINTLYTLNLFNVTCHLGPQVAQWVKNLPAMEVTQVQSLDQEDLLEEGMATCCSILAWRIPWTEEPGGLQSIGSQTQQLSTHMHTHVNCISKLWGETWLYIYKKERPFTKPSSIKPFACATYFLLGP